MRNEWETEFEEELEGLKSTESDVGWMDDVDLLDNELPDEIPGDSIPLMDEKGPLDSVDDGDELASILKEGLVQPSSGMEGVQVPMQLLGFGWSMPMMSQERGRERISRECILKEYFPGFRENEVLKFCELFVTKKAYLIPVKHRVGRSKLCL